MDEVWVAREVLKSTLEFTQGVTLQLYSNHASLCCYMIVVFDVVEVFSWQGETSSMPCYWMWPEVWSEENVEGSFKVLLFVF